MKNLVLAIVVASFAILGFFAYQSSQKVTSLQAGLEATEAALVTMEGEKAALEKQVADLQTQLDQMAAEAETAATTTPAPTEAPATEAPATEAPAADPAAPATNP